MRGFAAVLTIAAALAACTSAPAVDGKPIPRPPKGECDASRVQEFIGQRATAELGERLLREARARVLRWVPPNTAVTMDYQFDRLTVSYDQDMIIERISCG